MATQSPAEHPRDSRAVAPRSGWYGLIVFAGIMMILLGVFHVIAGLMAIFEDDYFLVTQGGLIIDTDYTAWGWTHLILGALVALAGAGLFTGAMWARVVAVVLAGLSAIVNLAFLSAYPLWSAIMIAIDILVIYAVTTHGNLAEDRR